MTLWVGGESDEQCKEDEETFVCTNCGDGFCESWESPCTCHEDCEFVENLCVQEGFECMNVCPEGWVPTGHPGCNGGKKCCAEETEVCLGAGAMLGEGFPGDVACCPGLAQIPDMWVVDDGDCAGSSSMICSDCGNTQCEDWENTCNCPGDCGLMPQEWCEFSGPDSSQCPSGAACIGPDYACGVPDLMGQCIQLNQACPMTYAPVCTCEGNQYDNPCLAHQAQQQIAWYGSCVGPDGMECVGLGEEIYPEQPSTSECCGDLDAMDLMPQGAGGACLPASGTICVKCGDLICGPGENLCICSGDCPNYGTPGGNG
jgi:hypothetical protein